MSDYQEEPVVQVPPLTAAEVARFCLARFRLGSWIIMGVVAAHLFVYRYFFPAIWYHYSAGHARWFPLYKWSVLELTPMLLAIASALLYRHQVLNNATVREHCSLIPCGTRDVSLIAIRRLILMVLAIQLFLQVAPLLIWLVANPGGAGGAPMLKGFMQNIMPAFRDTLRYLAYLLFALLIARHGGAWKVILGVFIMHLALPIALRPFRPGHPNLLGDDLASWLPAIVHLAVACVCLYSIRDGLPRDEQSADQGGDTTHTQCDEQPADHGGGTNHAQCDEQPADHGGGTNHAQCDEQPADPGGGTAHAQGAIAGADAERAFSLGLTALAMVFLQYLILGSMTGGRNQWANLVWILLGMMGATVIVAFCAFWFTAKAMKDPAAKRRKLGCAPLMGALSILGTLAMFALFYLVGMSIAIGGAR